jgi:hypothetical protein
MPSAARLNAHGLSARPDNMELRPTLWGRYGFDGGKGSRDACRANSTRLVKPAETQCNCGHAARTRGLINRDVHPRQPAGGECTPFSRLVPS